MENLSDPSIVMSDLPMIYPLVICASLSFCIAILDFVCIIGLVKSPKLQKSTFHFLTLCLSVGDLTTMIFTIVLLSNAALEHFRLEAPYLCSMCSSLVYCSLLFSLFQTLAICVDRYYAVTYTDKTSNRLSKLFSQKKLMPLLFSMCLMYTIVILFVTGFNFKEGCLGNKYSKIYMYLKETPIVALFLSIITLYAVIMYRLKRRLTMVSFVDQDITQLQQEQRNKRLKMNIVTLGLIILVLIVGLMPRIIIALIGPAESGNQGNITLMIPPLVNPIIYISRFVEFRSFCTQKICKRDNAN